MHAKASTIYCGNAHTRTTGARGVEITDTRRSTVQYWGWQGTRSRTKEGKEQEEKEMGVARVQVRRRRMHTRSDTLAGIRIAARGTNRGHGMDAARSADGPGPRDRNKKKKRPHCPKERRS